MNLEVKARWLAALRSGEYTQAHLALKNDTPTAGPSFCCLGVLTDLYIRETKPTEGWKQLNNLPDDCVNCVPSYVFKYDADGGLVPEVKEWLLGSDQISEDAAELLDSQLISYNDDQMLSFVEIADIIEKELL